MILKSGLLYLIAISLALTLAIAYMILPDHPENTITFPIPNQVCREDSDFKISYENDTPSIFQKGSGYSFMGNGTITANICHPKRLEITGYGVPAAGVMPRAFILLNGVEIGKFDFLQRKTVSLKVLQSGILSIVYINDFYESQTRTVFLSNFKFSGEKCKSINNIQTLGDNSIFLNREETYVISNTSKVKLYPCSAGRLFFDAAGTMANNSYPILKLLGALEKDINSLKSNSKKYSVYVSGSSVTFSISNPYSSVLQDRNLHLTKIKLSDIK